MCIVIFAHVPPPHHGQSYMVQLMLQGVRSSSTFPITIYHVDVRVSDGLADVGGIRPTKFLRLLRFCWQALKFRVFCSATTLYYIPAPPKKSAILRDLFALTLLRPFFPRIILHWHAVGLGKWARQGGIIQLWMRVLLRGADPAIVIAPGNLSDAEVFRPKRSVVIPNGIPDPCADFANHLVKRKERSALVQSWILGSRKQGPEDSIHVLYLGHCTRSKGLQDALDAMVKVTAPGAGLRWSLSIVGEFINAEEKAEAERLLRSLQNSGVEIDLRGFLSGTKKVQSYLESDILLFPSHSESFGLVAVEALACGLPVIGCDIPGLQAVLGKTPCALVPVGDAQAVATALMLPSSYVDPCLLRASYEPEFTLGLFQTRITAALGSEPSPP